MSSCGTYELYHHTESDKFALFVWDESSRPHLRIFWGHGGQVCLIELRNEEREPDERLFYPYISSPSSGEVFGVDHKWFNPDDPDTDQEIVIKRLQHNDYVFTFSNDGKMVRIAKR